MTVRRLTPLALAATAFVFLVSGASGADSFSLTVVSQTSSTITFSYPQQAGYGYLYSANGTVVSRTSNPAQTQVTFNKANTYEVASIVKGNTGSYPVSPSAVQCGDGQDNDADGKIDFPADPGCSSASDTSESPDPAPQPTASITQTIANGSTVTNVNGWRAVYDANGDNVEDDPGSVQFLVDGTQVLSEINAPFGDTFATGTITVPNGSHTFLVRAVSDGGTVLVTNQVTATVQSGSTPPPSGGFPDASNTGVPSGVTLTPTAGPITVSTAGTVLQNLDITYTGSNPAISVNAPNVTIRNVRIRSNGIALIQVNTGGSLLIEDSELLNRPAAGQPNCHNGIATGSYTARRLEITGCENGAEMFRGNVTFEDNYIHDLDTIGPSYVFGTGEPHTDGVQLNGGASNIVIRHNTIDPIGAVVGAGGTSGIIGNSSGDNIRIENNLIDGGQSSYAIYAPRTPKTAVFINGNKLGRGVYGYTACVRVGVTVTQFTGNTDASSGAPVAADEGAGGSCTN